MQTSAVSVLLLAVAAAAQPASLPPCKAGLKVPLVSPRNYSATILAVDEAKGSYQVKADSDGLVDWVPARSLRYSCVGGEAKAVQTAYFTGKWTLFSGPTPNYETINGKGYIVVGPGARVPPLVIRANRTYTWTLDSTTTINGTWRELAPNEMRSNSKPPAILLLNGEGGKDWQVWRKGVNAGNNQDAIYVDRMDLGLSYSGTRLP